MAWTSLTYAFGSKLTSAKMTQNQDNFTALAQGLSGAPTILNAALGTDSVQSAQIQADAVGQSEIAANSVGQSEIKTTTSTQSQSVGAESQYTFSLTGGAYTMGWFFSDSIGGQFSAKSYAGTTFAANLRVKNDSAGTLVVYAHSIYIQASKPYNLGDGEVGLFIFALIDKVTGEIAGSSVAHDPPWAYNGPTKVNNLLNSEYEYWKGYLAPGIYGWGGIKIFW